MLASDDLEDAMKWTDVSPKMRQTVIDVWSGTVAGDVVGIERAKASGDAARAAWLDDFAAANRAAIDYLAEPDGLVAKPDEASEGSERWEATGKVLREKGGLQ